MNNYLVKIGFGLGIGVWVIDVVSWRSLKNLVRVFVLEIQ